jgi:transcription elongation GreA/GreB family factor
MPDGKPLIEVGSTVTLAAPDGDGEAIKFTMLERKDFEPTRNRISAPTPRLFWTSTATHPWSSS